MGDQAIEEDLYSDDDLDALPESAFDQLQENAFRSTQLPRHTNNPRLSGSKPHKPNHATLAGGLGRLSVVGDTVFGRRPNEIQQASSDYGDLDDDMLDGEIYDANEQPPLAAGLQRNLYAKSNLGESTQREAWRQQRYSHPMQHSPTKRQELRDNTHGLTSLHHVSGHNSVERFAIPQNGNVIPASPNSADPGVLQDQVRKLLLEKDELQRAVESVNEKVSRRDGEISIVRANAAKLQADYKREKEAERQYFEGESSRAREQLANVKRELEEMTTNNQFLQRDVVNGAQEMRRLRASNAPDKDVNVKSFNRKTGPTTPKKHRSSLGDGFNDDNIQPLSPSRLVFREKNVSTPKAGSKRKRKVVQDSPSKHSLQLDHLPPNGSLEESIAIPLPPVSDGRIYPPRDLSNRNLVFVQDFLEYRFPGAEERTIEALAKYSFPSNPSKAFSTMLLDKLAPKRIRPDLENVPAAIALEIISLWTQCIQERYHDPVHLLLDQVKFILTIHPLKTAPELTNSLMSLLQETADILIIPRCQKYPPRSDRAQISSFDCLEVLHLMATQLAASREESMRFWRTMRFDFIMMLLSFNHPVEEIQLIILTLHTSILPNTFAMIIPPNDGKQDATEGKVLENLSRLLVEPPRPTQGEFAFSGVELADLRLSIVTLLEDMSVNDYAALAICRHKLVLGRLVRLMNDSLAHAYDNPPSHSKLIELVNCATRLLYYFLNNYSPEHINMQQKLSVIPGGEKKFLIVLTRLAFSEGVLLEDGIEDDVADIAHRMLEERVSPEEAEGLMDVMSTAPSTKSAPTRKESRDENEMDEDEGNNDGDDDKGSTTAEEHSDTSND